MENGIIADREIESRYSALRCWLLKVDVKIGRERLGEIERVGEEPKCLSRCMERILSNDNEIMLNGSICDLPRLLCEMDLKAIYVLYVMSC